MGYKNFDFSTLKKHCQSFFYLSAQSVLSVYIPFNNLLLNQKFCLLWIRRNYLQQMHPCPISWLVPNCPLLPRPMRGLAGPLLSAPVECASAAWLKKDGRTAEAGHTKKATGAPTKCQEIVLKGKIIRQCSEKNVS